MNNIWYINCNKMYILQAQIKLYSQYNFAEKCKCGSIHAAYVIVTVNTATFLRKDL